MNQIDMEMQVMAADFHLRHSAEMVPLVAAWHLVSATFPKLRNRFTAPDKPDAVYVALAETVREWLKSHLAAKGISEQAFESAYTDIKRVAHTSKMLQKIDELNAL